MSEIDNINSKNKKLVRDVMIDNFLLPLSNYIRQQLIQKNNWQKKIKKYLRDYQIKENEPNWEDPQVVLKIFNCLWHEFKIPGKLDRFERSLLNELIEVRNDYAHNSNSKFSFDYTWRALDSMIRLSKAVDSPEAEKIERVLQELITRNENQSSPCRQQEKGKNASWINISKRLIEKKKYNRLTSNYLTKTKEFIFRRNNIYIPINLSKYKAIEIQSGEDKKEKSRAEHDTSKTIKISDLTKKIGHVDRPIAIIGQPGAGKTTLLQEIADWMFEEQTEKIPIWIPLKEIGDKPLRKYLLEDWLADAVGKIDFVIQEERKESFKYLIESGRVLLLLDGIDEMTIQHPLQTIVTQLNDSWVSNTQVIVTCRLNTWNMSKSNFENFETYHISKFSLRSIEEFIDNWFKSINPQQGENLKLLLKKPEQEKVLNLIENPLCTMLLCFAWHKHMPSEQLLLPATKAKLYEWFTNELYMWNEEKVYNQTKQRELNEALGKLVLEAIENKNRKFCYSESLVNKHLGEYDSPLFKTAVNLGWLNYVGVSIENPLEKTYSFFHSSFAEYFAASAINDWHYFYNHVSHDIQTGTYKIFNPDWIEIILLWIGRGDIAQQDKNKFIQALLSFEDCCGNFYKTRAFWLATSLISEFKECIYSSNIKKQLLKQEFDVDLRDLETVKEMNFSKYFNILNWDYSNLRYITKDIEKSISILEKRLLLDKDREIIRSVQCNLVKLYRILGRIDPNHSQYIYFLVERLNSPWQYFNSNNEEESYTLLSKVEHVSFEIIDYLLQQTKQNIEDEDVSLYLRALEILSRIEPKNQKIIDFLEKQLEETNKEDKELRLSQTLLKADSDNIKANTIIKKLMRESMEQRICVLSALTILDIEDDNEEAWQIVISMLTKKDVSSAYAVLKKDFNDQYKIEAIQVILNSCLESLSDTDDVLEYCLDREELGQFLLKHPDNAKYLCNILDIAVETDLKLLELVIWLLRNAITKKYKQLALVKLENLLEIWEEKLNDYIYLEIIRALGKINPSHLRILNIVSHTVNNLNKIKHIEEEEENILFGIDLLSVIANNNDVAIDCLIDIINHSHVKLHRSQAAQALFEIGNGNIVAIKRLIKLISDEDEILSLNGTISLSDYANGSVFLPRYEHYINSKYFSLLVNALATTSDNQYKHQLLQHCAEHMSYVDFHSAYYGYNRTNCSESNTLDINTKQIAQDLNLQNLEVLLDSRMKEDHKLNQKVSLVCVDLNGICNTDNPALEIYDQILDLGYPSEEGGKPKTMVELKSYWNSLVRKSSKLMVIIIFDSSTFHQTSAKALNKDVLSIINNFKGKSVFISNIAIDNYKVFLPTQVDLINEIISWVEQICNESQSL